MLTPDPFAATPPLPAACNPRFVRSVSLIAALGGLLFARDGVVIGGAGIFFEMSFHL